MSEIEKYELHIKLCNIATPGYFISFDEWAELVKNAEKAKPYDELFCIDEVEQREEDWREFWAEVRANA